MSHEDHDVTPREFGEMTATLQYLAEEVRGLRTSWSTEFGKLHARLDEMREATAGKEEHRQLAQQVETLRGEVEQIQRSGAGQRTSIGWLRELLWVALGMVIAVAGLRGSGL